MSFQHERLKQFWGSWIIFKGHSNEQKRILGYDLYNVMLRSARNDFWHLLKRMGEKTAFPPCQLLLLLLFFWFVYALLLVVSDKIHVKCFASLSTKKNLINGGSYVYGPHVSSRVLGQGGRETLTEC